MIQRTALVIGELGRGGAERLLVHLVGGLRRCDITVDVITLGEKGVCSREIQDLGVPVHEVRSQRGYDVAGAIRLHRLLQRLKPDVINVHDRWSLPYVRLARWLTGRPPVVFSAHGLMFDEGERAGLKFRWAMRGVSAMTAVSEEVRGRHARFFGWGGPVNIVPNAVPNRMPTPEAGHALRGELGVSADTFVFLAVGNARPEKGFEDLLEAAARLRETSAKQIVVLVGGHMPESDYCARLRTCAFSAIGTTSGTSTPPPTPSSFRAAARGSPWSCWKP